MILSIVLVFGNFVSFKRAVAMEGTETAEDGQCDRKELVALRQTDSETMVLTKALFTRRTSIIETLRAICFPSIILL